MSEVPTANRAGSFGISPGFATRVFDFAMAHPDLMRLMARFGLVVVV